MIGATALASVTVWPARAIGDRPVPRRRLRYQRASQVHGVGASQSRGRAVDRYGGRAVDRYDRDGLGGGEQPEEDQSVSGAVLAAVCCREQHATKAPGRVTKPTTAAATGRFAEEVADGGAQRSGQDEAHPEQGGVGEALSTKIKAA